jgi:acyl dehydratase
MATALGLPGVVAHGMLTMAEAARVVTDWLGDPARLVEYGVRFVKPVPVPDDDDGAELLISAVVASVNDADGTAEIDISTEFDGQKVLGRARAVVRL